MILKKFYYRFVTICIVYFCNPFFVLIYHNFIFVNILNSFIVYCRMLSNLCIQFLSLLPTIFCLCVSTSGCARMNCPWKFPSGRNFKKSITFKPGFHMIVTVGDASPRQARGHIGDSAVKWKHFLSDVADQTGTVRGRIESVEMS